MLVNIVHVKARYHTLKTPTMQSNSSPESISKIDYANWQAELRENIRCPQLLLETLGLTHKDIAYSEQGVKQFPVNITRHFVSLMQYGEANDPLLRQVFPYIDESKITKGFSADPLNEFNHTHNGLIQKYHGRALLVMTGACAIHCRYCFRRHFPYQDNANKQQHWQDVFEQINNDKSLNEIILSGGDPLMLSDEKLQRLIQDLEKIKHLKRIRIHSRLPIILPSRVTTNLVSAFKNTRLKTILVVHSNHAKELNNNVEAASNKLLEANILLLNQAVLLKGVNDNIEALQILHERLFEVSIGAYYLHQFDPVQNAAHYAVPDKTAIELMQVLRSKLPGYMTPTLVKEEVGEPNKSPLL